MASDSATALALRPSEAAKALNISLRLLQQLTATGEVPSVLVASRCRRYLPHQLAAWLAEKAKPAPIGGAA